MPRSRHSSSPTASIRARERSRGAAKMRAALSCLFHSMMTVWSRDLRERTREAAALGMRSHPAGGLEERAGRPQQALECWRPLQHQPRRRVRLAQRTQGGDRHEGVAEPCRQVHQDASGEGSGCVRDPTAPSERCSAPKPSLHSLYAHVRSPRRGRCHRDAGYRGRVAGAGAKSPWPAGTATICRSRKANPAGLCRSKTLRRRSSCLDDGAPRQRPYTGSRASRGWNGPSADTRRGEWTKEISCAPSVCGFSSVSSWHPCRPRGRPGAAWILP